MGAETFTDAQKEIMFVMVHGDDNIVLVDLLFSTSFFFEGRLTNHHLCRRDVNSVFTVYILLLNPTLMLGDTLASASEGVAPHTSGVAFDFHHVVR